MIFFINFLSQFYYVPRQSNEEAYNLYCETTLLLFLPGANDKNFWGVHGILFDESDL